MHHEPFAAPAGDDIAHQTTHCIGNSYAAAMQWQPTVAILLQCFAAGTYVPTNAEAPAPVPPPTEESPSALTEEAPPSSSSGGGT